MEPIFILVIMTVLVALFAAIYRRYRGGRARRWMIGWIAIELHFATGALGAFRLIPASSAVWLAYATLLVAASQFQTSVSNARPSLLRRAAFWLGVFCPAVAYWTCQVAGVPAGPVYQVLLAVAIGTGLGLSLTEYRPVPVRLSAICALVAAPGIWVLIQPAHPGYGMDYILFTSFAVTGYTYWGCFRRTSPGVLLTSLSFLAWGCVWPAAEVASAIAYQVPGFLWDLPKYFVAFGMIVTLFENQTEALETEVRERKEAESLLRASEARLEQAQQMANIGNWEIPLPHALSPDCDCPHVWSLETYRIFDVNPANFRPTCRNFLDAVHPDDREMALQAARDAAATSSAYEIRYRVIRPNGEIRYVRERAMVIRGERRALTGTVQDVTRYRDLEEKLNETQRIEGLGRLAGGVAHDFNNLLTVINGYADLLLRKAPPSDEWLESLQEIRIAGEQAKSITGQLLMFSRKQTIQPTVLDLNCLVAEMQKMLQRLIPENIRIISKLHPNVGNIRADVGQVQQVLVNLAINAADAMPDGGMLLIETSRVHFEEPDLPSYPGAAPGDYVLLTVADTGMGMTPEVRARIFEPFFTTKERGKGTGLGLATVYGMVRQGGGWISVISEPGCGSSFRIYLPEDRMPVSERPAPVQRNGRGKERILVVEDQSEVRKLAVRALRDYGYETLSAANGEEALALCHRSGMPIDLVLTDVVMPGMNGQELIERIRINEPHMRALYMSGYPDAVIAGGTILEPEVLYLQKPFSAEALVANVRTALDRRDDRPHAKYLN